MADEKKKNHRGQTPPQDGRGKGLGMINGLGRNKNIGACKIGGVGNGKGQGIGKGKNRK